MLNDKEFIRWCNRISCPKEAVDLITQIRSSEPVRLVTGHGRSVVGHYPSRKMGRTLQFESHRCELSFIQVMERDDDVLEIWDQPTKLLLTYKSKNGRSVTARHTPDFLICWKDHAEFVECKTEDDLMRLAEESPNRYRRSDDDGWYCLPGQEYTQPLGIHYTLRSSASINPTYVRNVEFLDDYFREPNVTVSDESCQLILAFVKGQPGITLEELLGRIMAFETMDVTSDDIYRMIIRGDIQVNLTAAPLAEPGLVHIFPDAQSASAIAPIASRPLIQKIISLDVREGTRFLWDNKTWMITNLGEKNIWLLGETGDSSMTHELFDKYVNQNLIQVIDTQSTEVNHAYARGLDLYHDATTSEQEEAECRLEVILPYINGEKKLRGVKKERTIRRWISKYKEAIDIYDYGLAGLLPDYSGRGNSNKRLLDAVYRIMDDRIKNDYETPQQKSMLAVWGSVLNDCEAQGIPEKHQPSYVTFTKRVSNRPRDEQTEKRRGKRAAYRHKRFVYWIEHDTPRHGDRPFHIVHADHTKLDIELVCPITGENLGRPWASFLVDAYTRRLLAVVVTFDPPSYRSVMMLLRECVRRYNRLPQILVVDRGREFNNNYFRKLAAGFEITIKVRPKAKPRFGSVCERLFGIANGQFVHLLMGNTQLMTCVREVTKSVNPKNLAVWTLGDFTQWFCAWAYVFYDQQPHWTLKQSPAMAYARSIELTGKRRRLFTYNEIFRIRTMPTTRKGTAKNVVDKGVKINNIYYRCHELHDRALEGKQLPIRYDPFDISTAYVRIRGMWVRCLSEHYTSFQYCTERQLKIVSQEIRRKDSKLLKGRALSAKQLADFIARAERVQTELASKRLLLQRRRDHEFRPLMRFIDSATGEMYFAPHPAYMRPVISVSDGPAAVDQVTDTGFPTRSGINLDEIEICEELR